MDSYRVLILQLQYTYTVKLLFEATVGSWAGLGWAGPILAREPLTQSFVSPLRFLCRSQEVH
jgi:hypothetical protein